MTIRAVFWDFDGVILNSNAVRDAGFEAVLKDYPQDEVLRLLDYHRANGGLSRYVKFRYFFEQIRKETISEEQVTALASQFSAIMRLLLLDPRLLIPQTLDFIRQYHQKVKMHVVSGSDGEELRYLCNGLGIAHFFQSMEGSPTPKIKLLGDAITTRRYGPKECVLIGDSINDVEAARRNEVNFIAFNNPSLEIHSTFHFENLAACF